MLLRDERDCPMLNMSGLRGAMITMACSCRFHIIHGMRLLFSDGVHKRWHAKRLHFDNPPIGHKTIHQQSASHLARHVPQNS